MGLPFSQTSELQHAWEYFFRKLQAPNSRIAYSPAWGTPAQQHAWEYFFRKLQAPNSRIVHSPAWGAPPSSMRGSTFFASFRPQTPELCTAPRGGPSARVGVAFSQASGPSPPSSTRGITFFASCSTPPRGGPLLSRTFASFRPQTPESSSTRGSTFFASFRPQTPRMVYFLAWAPLQQHVWEYFSPVGVLFDKLQAQTPEYSPAARVGVPFSQASGPKLPNCVLAQHTWEYLFRKLQAPSSRTVYFSAWGPLPSSTRGSTFFASFRPQTPELCTPPRDGPSPTTRGSTFFTSFRPQTPELCIPQRGPQTACVGAPFSQASRPKLPNCVLS